MRSSMKLRKSLFLVLTSRLDSTMNIEEEKKMGKRSSYKNLQLFMSLIKR